MQAADATTNACSVHERAGSGAAHTTGEVGQLVQRPMIIAGRRSDVLSFSRLARRQPSSLFTPDIVAPCGRSA